MKKLISILIVAAMMLAAFVTSVTTFADDGVTSEESSLVQDFEGARDALDKTIKSASELIPTDYTDETALEFSSALSTAELVYADKNAEYNAILNAISDLDTAVRKLIAKKADFTYLKGFYAKFKYSDTTKEYNQIDVQNALCAAEKAFENKKILISELAAVEQMFENAARVEIIDNSQSFMEMRPDGNYVLVSDIDLHESYGEFCGYLNGNGHSVTVSNVGAFTTLNHATVMNLQINGHISKREDIGALATNAKGEVKVIGVTNNTSVNVEDFDAIAAGFIANCDGAEIEFLGCTNNAPIMGGTASGFVATATEQTWNTITFNYCSNFGQITSTKSSASAFFSHGESYITMYGCVAGTDGAPTLVNSEDSCVGGIVGYVSGKGDVDINTCYFNISIELSLSTSNTPVALVVADMKEGNLSVKNTFVKGNITSHDDDEYRVTSVENERVTLENVFIDVSLKKITQEHELIENANALDDLQNTDWESLDEKLTKEFDNGIVALLGSAIGNDLDKRVEATEFYLEALQNLKTKEEAALDIKKGEWREAIDILVNSILPEDYTAESYAIYLSEIEKIRLDVDNADSETTLENLSVAKLLAEAMAKLVTVKTAKAEADAKALADAKAVALDILSAKRENAGDVFTKTSYEEYIAAFDAIVAKINGASTLLMLENIDVASLKVDAENKLVVNIPDADESEDDGDNVTPDIDDKGDDKDDDDEDNKYETVNKSGCASSMTISALALVCVVGAVVSLTKKEDQLNS